jgi:hypothetical protein
VNDQTFMFGEWDAPATDDAVPVGVPLHLTCMTCQQNFALGDNGAVWPTGYAQHRECSLRSVLGGIGHHVDHERYCHGELGPDAGLPIRVSSLLVWRHHVQRVEVTVEELDVISRVRDLA